jgi:hypothetical protein
MRSLFARFLKWMVSQSPFLGPPHDVTIERAEAVRNRHEREFQEFHRMMQRQRDRLMDEIEDQR